MNNMQNWKKLIIILILYFNYVFSNEKTIDKTVIMVNNKTILNSYVDKIFFLEKFKINKENKIDFNIFHKFVIEKIISEKLLESRKKLKSNNKKINYFMSKLINNKKDSNKLKNNLLKNKIDNNFYKITLRKKIKILNMCKKMFHKKIIIHTSIEEINYLSKKIFYKNKKKTNVNLSKIFLTNLNFDFKKSIKKKEIIKKVTKGINLDNKTKRYFKNLKFLKQKQEKWFNMNQLPKIFFIYNKKNNTIGPFLHNSKLYIIKINDVMRRNSNFLINKIRVKHIFLKSSLKNNSKELYKKLNKVLHSIKNKEKDFSYMAKTISEDKKSFSNKGDLGWLQINRLEKNIKKKLNKLKRNKISKPIHSKLGWHLFKVLEKKIFDESEKKYKQKVYNVLYKRDFFQLLENLTKEKKSSSYIKFI